MTYEAHDWRGRETCDIQLSNSWGPMLRAPCGEEESARASKSIFEARTERFRGDPFVQREACAPLLSGSIGTWCQVGCAGFGREVIEGNREDLFCAFVTGCWGAFSLE